MKAAPPSLDAQLAFGKIQLLGVLVLTLAAIPWLAQDFVFSLGATELAAHTTLRTTQERNPTSPTHSALHGRKSIALDGVRSLIVGLVALAIAIYATFYA